MFWLLLSQIAVAADPADGLYFTPPHVPPRPTGVCAVRGQRMVDGEVCCWPGQTVKDGTCAGTIRCPTGMVTVPGGCDVLRQFEVVQVPAGSFKMGAPDTLKRTVSIDAFVMTKTEVTQKMFKDVMGINPSSFSGCGELCPVESVNWYDAVVYANTLSRKEGLAQAYLIDGDQVVWVKDAPGWRLPTEAEWEYAARGGTTHKYSGFDFEVEAGWVGVNSAHRTHRVCSKQTNGFGLCDMTGNVWEWVWDRQAPYQPDEVDNPSGPDQGAVRLTRGGSWGSGPGRAAVYVRNGSAPTYRRNYQGIRLVRNGPTTPVVAAPTK